MSNIIHLNTFLSNLDLDLKFENQSTAVKIIKNLIRIESINKTAFSNIDQYLEGFADCLYCLKSSLMVKKKDSFKEKLKQVLEENAD